MKQILLLAFFAASFTAYASCSKYTSQAEDKPGDTTNSTGNKMKIKVGSSTFTATLSDNETAKAFRTMLPLTVKMIELNGNEKYIDLPRSLPTNSVNPGMIQNGDLLLYGSSTLVLFYRSFSTSYSYTRLGSISDVTGLVKALGTGNVEISFSLE